MYYEWKHLGSPVIGFVAWGAAMTNSNALSELALSIFCKEGVQVISWK